MRRFSFLLLSVFSFHSSGWAKIEPETYVYKTVGDLPISLDVYQPEEGENRPVIVWIHGGALIIGSKVWIKQEQLKAYLDHGYVVVSIDYRLAPETKLPEIIADVRDALIWVREKGPEMFGIDPNRMAVVGHSAGGYLTLMSGTLIDPPPKALVSFYGYGDIVGEWYTEPDPFYLQQDLVSREEAIASVGNSEISGTTQTQERGKFYLYCRQTGLWPDEVGGVSQPDNPEFFEPFCPVRNVTKDYPPTLLIHGDQDTDVPVEQSLQMESALRKAGVEVETMILKGKWHGFDSRGIEKDPVVREVFDRVFAFLEKHLAVH
ncbi:MAG: alpha/beta hydrolase [Candidatus Omnitrophica bacterium]|nr:alpha/beta hydrolase [Candidatus Omnitrophota bacterium]